MDDDKLILTIVVLTGLCFLIILIAVIVFVCTYHGRNYKNMKQPIKTKGVIDDIHVVSVPLISCDDYIQPGDYYKITCSYNDNIGCRHTFTFDWNQCIGDAGDEILLHCDAQNPDKCIADCQLQYGKNLWWKVLLILGAIIGLAVFITMKFGDY